jgi:hypothetical protein
VLVAEAEGVEDVQNVSSIKANLDIVVHAAGCRYALTYQCRERRRCHSLSIVAFPTSGRPWRTACGRRATITERLLRELRARRFGFQLALPPSTL